jgi:hypothetical protein
MTDVYLEVGSKRVFACAFDWPGWLRSGRDEAAALEALAAYRSRYFAVTTEAGLQSPDARLEVIERLPGSASTDFGAPGAIPSHDWTPLERAASERIATLVRAAWTVFDRVVAGSPAELRKGPRGGGRDRDKIVDHVINADSAYAGRLGVKLQAPARESSAAVGAFRVALLNALQHPVEGAKWPPAYAARRIAWHALDHAWEIQDRTQPG